MDNYCFSACWMMGCPHIFPTFIHPKKNGNDTAGYDFRLLEIQNPLASNFLTFVEKLFHSYDKAF